MLVAILGVVVLLGAAFGVWRYMRLTQELSALKSKTANPQTAAREQVDELIATVGKLMVLPTNELPTVATVDDTSKLKDPFFADAKKGDRVLLYTHAGRIILYRPSENKIIDVSVVNVGSTSATPATVSFILWNGTPTVGLTKLYTTTLTKKIPNAAVIDTASAKKNDYAKTVLVDLTGKKTDEAKTLAGTLGISVSPLPAGETKPVGADFLIIVGADEK